MAIVVFLQKKIRYSLLSDKCLRWNWQQLLKFAWLALPSRAPNCKPAVAIAGRSGSTGPFERRGRGTCARVFPALQFCERWFDEENAVEKNLCCYFCFCYGCLLKSTICYCCSALTCLLRKMLSCGATKSYLWSRYDKINLEATIATFFSLSYYLYRFHESYFWNNKKNEDFNEV